MRTLTAFAFCRDSFYTEKDLYEINRLLRLLIMEGRGVLSDLLEQTAKTLMVDRISVFWRDGNTPMAVNPLADKGKPSSVMIEPEYIGMFSDDMYVTSNVWLLENSQPKLYGEFQEAEICGTMQHLLRDAEGRVCGIVTADDCKNIHSFPKVAEHIFENLCEVVNAVLCREDS